ncbi:HEAT repeat domain-containing protein [Nostoc sp.]|uniref:HEAT repeat domain-containing protein n=1 Tax=Nostoc sp. TaxID=1180 RepID=UPI002FF73B91
MLEWLTMWGVSGAVGFLFQPVIAQFAQELGKDLLKDVFKDVLKAIPAQTLQRLKKKEKDIAVGKAFKEFLELVQQELQSADFTDTQVQEYTKPLKTFLNEKRVQEVLGSPFNYGGEAIDVKTLQKIWYELNLLSLPEEFNWIKLGKLYVKKVKAIILASPELRDILDSKNLDKIQVNTTEMAGKITEFDLERYQEGICERYENLKLDSLDTSGYAYNELKLWRIFTAQNVRETDQVLAQVHELPKEHLRRLRETDQVEAEIELEELERHKRVYFEQPIRSVLDVVNKKQDYKYIVILGDPGSGKSTLLQFLALNWAKSPLDNAISLPIPLLIELRTYMRRREDKECNNFLEFFHQCSGVIHHLNQLELDKQLKAGNALVMFDGLDEVFDPGKREDVITDIHRFTNEYPNVQVIVTSRIIGYKPQRLRDAQFRHFILQDLDSEQIRDFINRWHELTFTDAVDKVRKRERLQKGIDTSKAIAELAGNPLLLTMMAILNRNQELPRDRATLYEQSSKVLLHQWDIEAKLLKVPHINPYTIDLKNKQAMLRQVAYKMQGAKTGLAGNLISKDDLENTLIGYLEEIKVDRPPEIARLMIEQLRERNFILCYMGADCYAFVHRTFLEYFCACEFDKQFAKRGYPNGLTIEELKTDVFGKHWQDETWHEVLLLIAGMIEAEFVGEILDYLMMQDGEEEKFVNLFLASKCLVEVRNRSAIASTATKLLNQIKERAIQDDNWEVRSAAVRELAKNFKDESDTKSWLKERASQDDYYFVRSAAFRELAKNFKDDPETKSWLKERATQDDYWLVRLREVQELAKNFKDDPETKSWLKERATKDDHNDVRRAAVEELAKNFKDDPETKSILKERATKDDHNDVRRAAVEELAKNFKDDADLIDIYHQCAINDPFESSHKRYNPNPRQIALEIIIKQFPQHEQTLPLLRDRAENDPDEKVREYAQKKLAQLEK